MSHVSKCCLRVARAAYNATRSHLNNLVPQRGNFIETIHTTWFDFGAVFGPTGSIAILYIVGANLLMTTEGGLWKLAAWLGRVLASVDSLGEIIS